MEINVDAAHFSSAHFIPGHPKCGRLHGHSYSVRVYLQGDVDDTRMLVDFGILKEAMRDLVLDLDHRVLLARYDARTRIETHEGQVSVAFDEKEYRFPEADVSFFDAPSSTAEDLAFYLRDRLREQLEWPLGARSLAVSVDEGPRQGARSDYIDLG